MTQAEKPTEGECTLAGHHINKIHADAVMIHPLGGEAHTLRRIAYRIEHLQALLDACDDKYTAYYGVVHTELRLWQKTQLNRLTNAMLR